MHGLSLSLLASLTPVTNIVWKDFWCQQYHLAMSAGTPSFTHTVRAERQTLFNRIGTRKQFQLTISVTDV